MNWSWLWEKDIRSQCRPKRGRRRNPASYEQQPIAPIGRNNNSNLSLSLEGCGQEVRGPEPAALRPPVDRAGRNRLHALRNAAAPGTSLVDIISF